MRTSSRLLFLLLLLWSSVAFADELQDFEHARDAYLDQDYDNAVTRLESLVGGPVPRVQNPVLVLESRKYLAAAYLFLERRGDAERQFRLLLIQDPSYEIDPLAFPEAVRSVFQDVREVIERERREVDDQAQADARRREQEAIERMIRQEARIARLEELATAREIVRENSRAEALIPFGYGQFRNGHRGLGIALAVGEAVSLIGALISFYIHQSLPRNVDEVAPSERARFEVVEQAARVFNWASTGVLGGLLVVGWVDAQVRFVPQITRTETRPLPPELEEGEEALDPGLEATPGAPTSTRGSLRVGPGTLGFELQF